MITEVTIENRNNDLLEIAGILNAYDLEELSVKSIQERLRSLLPPAEVSTLPKRSKLPNYRLWSILRSRCWPTGSGFEDYDLFVLMDRSWFVSFDRFNNYVNSYLGPKPSAVEGNRYCFNRVELPKGFVPGNVRWATAYMRANNTKSSLEVTVHGVTQTLAQWAWHHKRYLVSYAGLYARYNKFGARAEQVLPELLGLSTEEILARINGTT